MNENCVFCNIVAGKIPSAKVYEDGDVLAFMDIGPVMPGHVLVIPKRHFNPIWNLPDDLLAKVLAVAKRIAKAQIDVLGADGVNLFQTNGEAAGQTVPHVHFHVVPRKNGDGAGWAIVPRPYASPAEAAALADRLRNALA